MSAQPNPADRFSAQHGPEGKICLRLWNHSFCLTHEEARIVFAKFAKVMAETEEDERQSIS